MDKYIEKIAGEMELELWQVRATALLLAEGSTVPFVARYRKETTGSLDEVAITAIRDRVAQLAELDKRREAILKSLKDHGNLTDELKEKILDAESLAVLEDIYLPFRPKRRTRAAIARERGLEPLAHRLFSQEDFDPLAEASSFVDSEKGVESIEEALSGARDIMAEWINEDERARAQMRSFFFKEGVFTSRVAKGKEAEGAKYKDYFEWQEPAVSAPSHRILAMRRGEKEGFVSLSVVPSEEGALALLERIFVKGDSLSSEQVKMAVHDSYKRLLSHAMETELRIETKKRADGEAIRIFANNLRQLLLAPPLGQKRLLAIDPGFRTGCKVVCLDPQGKLMHTDTIYPFKSERERSEGATKITELCGRFKVEAIAIGNGTGGRETEAFIKGLSLPEAPQVVLVNESGASVYSASEAAREEFPNQDVTVRGAVSIGRRLMAPLAELVKIDPKSIGVGQYQHDVDQKSLKESVDGMVSSCVNAVGVEANTASWQLLTYVSGLGPQLARNIVIYRDEHGPFSSRDALRRVPRLGAKAFEQAAGFLRVRGGSNPLEESAVHPESYHVVEAMARNLDCSVQDLMREEELQRQIKKEDYVTEKVGIPTLNDILEELARPGRDPRKRFEGVVFADNVQKMEDVSPGMELPGVVTNITAFGAFVDIGVHQDGLVHISELSDRFVRDPHDVVKVHQKVVVRVLDVDHGRKRIALSMKGDRGVTQNERPVQDGRGTRKKASGVQQKPGKSFFNNPFVNALKRK
jgi:uncharacterized protein